MPPSLEGIGTGGVKLLEESALERPLDDGSCSEEALPFDEHAPIERPKTNKRANAIFRFMCYLF